jgi:hemerythrin-like domain-containing protein
MELACLAQLDRSHRRHDDVMEGLLAAARRLAAGRPDTNDVETVRDAVAYFERSVTRHFLDEEGSVFPRLSTRRPDLAEQLAALSAEHPPQIALQNAVAEAARQLDGNSIQGAGKSLLEVAERLAEQHRGHVDREDKLFASAKDALTAEDDAEITAEMETRRDRDDESGVRGGGGGGGGGRGGGGGGGGGRGGGGGGRADRAVRPTTNMRAMKPAAKKPAKKASITATAKRAAKTAKKPAKKTAAKKPAKKSTKRR